MNALKAGIVVAVLAAGAASLVPAGLAGQQATFRAGIDLVNFGVTVTDRKGVFIDDLTIDDFEIIEDGKKQTPTYFSRGDQTTTAPPLHIGLLFDTSGSMGEDIKLARSAAVRFLNTLSDAVDMTLVDFDTEVRVAKYGQKDFPRMVERIRSRQPDGWTAMYDALGVFLDGAAENDGRTILLLYTDGGDTRIGQPLIEGLRVLAEVVDHPSKKYYIQKFRKRKNYRRFKGHRQWYTQVRVRHILLPGVEAPPPPAPKPVEQPAASTPPAPTPPAPPA